MRIIIKRNLTFRISAAHHCEDRRLKRVGGFTIIELVAVIVLMGILSLTAIPTLSNLADTRKAAGAAQLLREIHFARQRAVARGVRTWVVFDVVGDSYALFAEDATNPGRANRTGTLDPVTGKSYSTDLANGMFAGGGLTSVAINGDVEVGFDFLGRALAADENVLQTNGTIELLGGHRIIIVARTGYAYRAP